MNAINKIRKNGLDHKIDKILEKVHEKTDDGFVFDESLYVLLQDSLWHEISELHQRVVEDIYVDCITRALNESTDKRDYKRYKYLFETLCQVLDHGVPNHPLSEEDFRTMHMPNSATPDLLGESHTFI